MVQSLTLLVLGLISGLPDQLLQVVDEQRVLIEIFDLRV